MGRPRYQRPSVLKTNGNRPRWYIRVMVDVLVDRNRTARKERTIYLGFCDETGKRIAEKIRDEKLREVNNTPLVIQSQVLFKDLAAAYRSTYLPGLKPSTRYDYSHRLTKYIVPEFGDLRLFEVDAIRVQQWIFRLETSGLSKGTRRTNLAVLRSLFDAAEEWGFFVGRNPSKKTKLGGGGEVFDKRALEPQECLRLLRALDGEGPLNVIVEGALYTGLRISELLGLTWGSLKNGFIEVKQARSQRGELADPKSARGHRRIELGPLATRFVRAADARDADLVWPNEDYFSLQQKFRRCGKAAGIAFKGFGFHTLRRTHATLRNVIGATQTPDAALVRDMGHASAAMTEHYIRGTKTGVVERLQNLISFSGEFRDSGQIN